MVERKIGNPVTEDDELFVRKTKFVSKSTKKTIEFHDFIKDIEDEEKKMKAIISPKFKLAGAELISPFTFTRRTLSITPLPATTLGSLVFISSTTVKKTRPFP